jgi:hypothetical protein
MSGSKGTTYAENKANPTSKPTLVTVEHAAYNYVDMYWLISHYSIDDPSLSVFAFKGYFMSSSPSLEDVGANVCDEVRSLVMERLKHLPIVSRHV